MAIKFPFQSYTVHWGQFCPSKIIIGGGIIAHTYLDTYRLQLEGI